MRFITYVPCEKAKVEFEVKSKIRTNVRGHYTYMLQGITDKGNVANALVNKSQWDEFDVPVEERVIDKKIDRKKKRIKAMQPVVGRKNTCSEVEEKGVQRGDRKMARRAL